MSRRFCLPVPAVHTSAWVYPADVSMPVSLPFFPDRAYAPPPQIRTASQLPLRTSAVRVLWTYGGGDQEGGEGAHRMQACMRGLHYSLLIL